MNYTFLDAFASVKTAASSTIGGIEYPIVRIQDGIVVSVVGTPVANQSVSGTVLVGNNLTISSVLSTPGIYAEDSAHTSGEAGRLVLSVRNDSLSSVTSASGDYSPFSTGPVGEVITGNAPITNWIRGDGSVVSANVTTSLIAAQGASVFGYLTSAQISNTGATTANITFLSAGSVLGYGIAPTGGGAIISIPNALKSQPNTSIDFKSSAASSIIFVSGQGFSSKT